MFAWVRRHSMRRAHRAPLPLLPRPPVACIAPWPLHPHRGGGGGGVLSKFGGLGGPSTWMFLARQQRMRTNCIQFEHGAVVFLIYFVEFSISPRL